MWWKWAIFAVCGLAALACNVSTAIEWMQGKTGPTGPKPENWWGCAGFTVVCALPMIWVGRHLF